MQLEKKFQKRFKPNTNVGSGLKDVHQIISDTDIELTGDIIKLTKTLATDINEIIEFEISNKSYIHHDSKARHVSMLSNNDCLHLSIRRIDNDKLIGHIILFGLADPNKVLEFRRITINEKGMGFGREAIRLIKRICFERLRFHRLWLDVYDDNERAIKLYKSEGFAEEGARRENIKSKYGYRSQRIYSMLENEYKRSNAT